MKIIFGVLCAILFYIYFPSDFELIANVIRESIFSLYDNVQQLDLSVSFHHKMKPNHSVSL
jgi:hypothetical protein